MSLILDLKFLAFNFASSHILVCTIFPLALVFCAEINLKEFRLESFFLRFMTNNLYFSQLFYKLLESIGNQTMIPDSA